MAFLIDPKVFASKLRYFRTKQSYTVKELAARTELAVGTIQMLESGTHAPNQSQLTKVAGALALKHEVLVLPRPPEVEYYEAC